MNEPGTPARWSPLLALLVLPLLSAPAPAQPITVPNYSFESPALAYAPPYAAPEIDDWQKAPVPAWWTAAGNSAEQWTDACGVFVNVSFAPVAGCDGNQLAFMFSVPGYELYQTLSNSYQVGQSYQLTVGIQGGGYGMQVGCPMAIELYYPDANGNRIAVGSTTVLNNNSTGTLSQLTDYTLTVPAVTASAPWAGQPIGIDLVQTATSAQAGGYWDIDNVRLTATTPPPLTWTGSASGNWNATQANWQQRGAVSTYGDGLAVVFDDTGTNSSIAIQAGGVCPASVTFDNTALAYTFSGGPIAGTTGLVLDGSGTVTLENSNAYTGGTSVNSGVLVLENSAAIPAGSLLSIGASGSVVLGTQGAAELGLLAGGGPVDSLDSPSEASGGGATTVGPVQSVPEPATLVLAIAGAAVLPACRWAAARPRRMADRGKDLGGARPLAAPSGFRRFVPLTAPQPVGAPGSA
jgi:autotransporter-associated beta strand protein